MGKYLKSKAAKKNPKLEQYITRTKAMSKLSVSLRIFRRLCILKGIFPREPTANFRSKHGKSKIYYLTKDIQFLAHDPILEQMRAYRAYERKVTRAKGR